MGFGDIWVLILVGVFFGFDGIKMFGKIVFDFYFGGVGLVCIGCLECGCCMMGCCYGVKNILVKNYFGFVELVGV